MILFDKISEIKNKIVKKLRFILANNKEAVRFLLLFLSFSIIFFLFYFLIQESLTFILVGTAEVTGFFSNLIGLSVSVDEMFISLGTMDFEIIHECTGIFAIMITSSSILAYPAQFKEKVLGIVFIVPLILSLNLFRLLFLVYIGKVHQHLFEVVHSYLWQGTFIIFIILAWFLWIELVVNK